MSHRPQRRPGRLTIGLDCRFIQDKFHGIGRYTYQLLTHLCALEGDHEVVAFVDPALPNTRFPLDALASGGRLALHPIRVPLYHPAELTAWPRILRARSVDVLHVPYFWSPLALPCPLVTTIHDMIFDRYPEYMPRPHLRAVYWLSSRAAIRRSRRIIAVSEATRADILAYGGGDVGRVRVVPEGVEPSFAPVRDPAALRAIRERYALPERYVLALGARRPHKNIARLVEAFAAVADDLPHTLVLAGDADRRFDDEAAPALRHLRSRGRVVETGFVAETDLPALYSMAELFVQPSIIEGFGLPVLEAMACGCAVACADSSSLPEVAGDDALLFDPRDSAAMAMVLRAALGAPALRADLARRGRTRAAAFSWERTARETLGVYHAAVGGAR
jgi:alpha-1,3-rhamnosyl/mannosyltransferase